MGKHNGKARRSGISVGAALTNQAKREGKSGKGAMPSAGLLHTTDVEGNAGNMQSVIENNDLGELISMADLAGKDFIAEKQQVIVLSTGAAAVPAQDRERAAAARLEAQAKHQDRLRVPRRPHWDSGMAPEVLDRQERASFLEWRRGLAKLEEEEGLVLTPFEKNLEVWRQLWRVLERSDIVVQVLDARDPLRYRSEDLEAYAREQHPTKASLLLLNKADLLPVPLRHAWAQHFAAMGADAVFWSATAAADEGLQPAPAQGHERGVAAGAGADGAAQVLGCEELLAVLRERAQRAVEAKGGEAPEPAAQSQAAGARRLMVGLTGYPNVGKSSTINALFGSKKTAVAPTPGKTKHFQTLNVADGLTLCDCPGLVLPRYAASKAEMVAAGVISIDRLTDVRAPIEVIMRRITRQQLERVYGIRLQAPAASSTDKMAAAAELLRAHSQSKGWVVGSGLPDEMRSGRQILKDFVGGKLLHCVPPPGCKASAAELGLTGQLDVEPDSTTGSQEAEVAAGAASGQVQPEVQQAEQVAADAGQPQPQQQAEEAEVQPADVAVSNGAAGAGFTEADTELMQSIQLSGADARPRRADHKFQKKPTRTKGTRGKEADAGGYDGAALLTGRRGGLVRVPSMPSAAFC